jgi:hypothetical protein
MLFFKDVSESVVSAFVSGAIGRLGTDAVTVVLAGAEWPDCAGVRADCERVREQNEPLSGSNGGLCW